MTPTGYPVAIVIATRNRADGLGTTLSKLQALPERPEITVVDNASTDGSAELVGRDFPNVNLIRLESNLGAAARNEGARASEASLIAFCDDDSWWAPGSLAVATEVFESHPRLGLLAGRVLVGDDGRVDPTCDLMANSPLGHPPELPGPRILGFIACGAIVRREAFLEVNGFDRHFGIGGEEDHVALSMAALGWDLAYLEDLVVHHHPSPIRDRGARIQVLIRNRLWTTWLLRPAWVAIKATVSALRLAVTSDRARRGVVQALRGLPWVLRRRRRVPMAVEAMARTLAELKA